MKTREMIAVLLAAGYRWNPRRGKGSHRVFRHPTRPTIVLPYHGENADIPEGGARAILERAGLRKR
ncbi:MAG: type II toxin-antitoxin system HicA family toxin [Candidatus Eremiobacteraeota bacterium]|nr:type II toxin-antitoxin system HicA family toxin [Candidatus Eremiobacteraeota bacterium]